MMIDIPFTIEGEISFQNYQEVEERIFEFDEYKIIGRDSSDTYNMYLIELGDESKPTILIMAGLHGTEWQGTQYSMSFVEQLRDNTFPNVDFRNELLNNFHIAYIPVANPWGLNNTTEHAITAGRRNSNNVDLNRDFIEFSQQETKNLKDVMLDLKPFAYLDCHLIRTNKDREELLIVGNGHPKTDYLKEQVINSLEAYSGLEVDNWPGGEEANPWISRIFMGNQSNDYTPYTLSILTEITRPVEEKDGFKAPLSDDEIYNYGTASMYIFLKTSINYYKQYNGSIITEINEPTKTITITRDVNGITETIEEKKESEIIETTFTRGVEGIIQKIIRKIKSLK